MEDLQHDANAKYMQSGELHLGHVIYTCRHAQTCSSFFPVS